MSRHGHYDSFKRSNGGWLGEIPSHWQSEKLKYIAEAFASNVDKKSKEGEPPVRLCNYTDVYYNERVTGELEYMKATATPEQIEKFALQEGDTIITKDSEGPDDIAIPTFVPERLPGVICGYHLSMIRPSARMAPRYLNLTFKCGFARAYFATRANGLTRYGLGSQALGEVVFPVPPLEEQTQIAKFLDYETARIDALIDKQQQLIALLKEKRQAVISHAVTKGLNPDAPMKDSGVEYFAEVPEHWSVARFGLLSEVVRGGSPRPAGDPRLFNGDYSPWVTVSEITKDTSLYLDETATFLTRLGSEQCRVFQPDILLLSNSGATLGVPKVLRIQANANDGVLGFERLRLPLRFAYFYLTTLTERLREEIKNKGGSTQINLNTDIAKQLPVPLPPDEEAEAIGEYLERELGRYAELEKRAQDAIELLQERRTALISAAVTGKIDVREWKAPESDKEVA